MQGYFIRLYICIKATDTQDLLGMHEEFLAMHRNIRLFITVNSNKQRHLSPVFQEILTFWKKHLTLSLCFKKKY